MQWTLKRKSKIMLNEIDKLKYELNSKKPFPKETLRSIEEDNFLRWTYHSNAIEGNTLTLTETKVVLEGITIGGKRLVEHLEVINHKEAIEWLMKDTREGKEFNLQTIKTLHYLVLKNIYEEAGKFRTMPVLISGASHTPPDALFVQENMDTLVEAFKCSKDHPVVAAAKFHADFVKIHPFIDGNGRTGRLILNYMLMLSGYLPIIIHIEDKLNYYKYLDLACSISDYEPIIQMVQELERNELKRYLSFMP